MVMGFHPNTADRTLDIYTHPHKSTRTYATNANYVVYAKIWNSNHSISMGFHTCKCDRCMPMLSEHCSVWRTIEFENHSNEFSTSNPFVHNPIRDGEKKTNEWVCDQMDEFHFVCKSNLIASMPTHRHCLAMAKNEPPHRKTFVAQAQQHLIQV